MAEMSPKEFGRAALKFFSNPIFGLYSEGVTLTLLEDNGIRIIRSQIKAPCHAAILLDDFDCGDTRLSRLYRCTDDNVHVIPFDTERIGLNYHSRQGTLEFDSIVSKSQQKLAQFILIEVAECPLIRLIVPRPLFHATLSNLTPLIAYASRIPSAFSGRVVKCHHLPKAFNRILEYVKDPTKTYINPTTHTSFPRGMLGSIGACDVLVGEDASEQNQLRMLYDAASKHDSVLNIHPIPVIVSDFVIHIEGRIVSFEARINSFRTYPGQNIMRHTITLASYERGNIRRLFYHTQMFQYLFIRCVNEAYVIPRNVLPDAWYMSNTLIHVVPLTDIAAYKIDLSTEDWFTTLIEIVNPTKHAEEPQHSKPMCSRHFKLSDAIAASGLVADEFIDVMNVSEEDSDQDTEGIDTNQDANCVIALKKAP